MRAEKVVSLYRNSKKTYNTMAKNKSFKGHLDIDQEIPVSELMRLCKLVLSQDLSAVVTIRQTGGTDFPPFIALESQDYHDKTDQEGIFENLLV